MIINSNEFIEFVKKHLSKYNSHNDWNVKIDKMNDVGLLEPNTYQALKTVINN